MRLITSIAAGVLAVVAVWVLTGRAPEAQGIEPDPETVIYSSIRPPNWDLYLFEQPGSPPRRLTTNPGLDYNAAISPDGRWVVFTSERTGSPDLYRLRLDVEHPGAPQPLLATNAMEDAATFSPDGRTLVFVSTRDGSPDIFTMPFAPDDAGAPGEPINLTRHEAGDYNPVFSPDGTRILFSSSRDASDAGSATAAAANAYEASELYVMHADGTGVRRLTRHEGWDGSPAWTPEGESIAFYSERDGEPRIYRMREDGSGSRPVGAPGAAALSPAFGPDGRLAFTVRRDDRWTIVSAGPDGSDLRVESDTARDYWAPAYDPASGHLIAHGPGPVDEASRFESDEPGAFFLHPPQLVELPDRSLSLQAVRGYLPTLHLKAGEVATSEAFSRLVVASLDGTQQRVVFDRADTDRYRGDVSVWGPSWSSDGQWLAFGVGLPFGAPTEDVDIWKSRSDGSEAMNVTADSDANDAFPDFSPDGRRIVFRSTRDGNAEIYVMDADGTNVHRLTRHDATDTMPAFSSQGDRVAFSSLRDGDYEIYLLDVDAQGNPGRLERLTRSPGRDMHPRFSPDDRWVLFTSERGKLNDELPLSRVIFQPQPYGELHAVRLEDKEVVRLTHNKWEDGPSAWER